MHQAHCEEVEEALDVSIDEAIGGALGSVNWVTKGPLDTELEHRFAELEDRFRVLVQTLLPQVVKEAIDLLLLPLWVSGLVK